MENSNFNYVEQEPFATAEFADNPEPRCPCILLLDTSGSELDLKLVEKLRREIYRQKQN